MNVRFVRLHKASCAIYIFLILMIMIHIIKPKIIYNEYGGFRIFGLSYRNKTILPIWIVSIILAIFSYLAILLFIAT